MTRNGHPDLTHAIPMTAADTQRALMDENARLNAARPQETGALTDEQMQRARKSPEAAAEVALELSAARRQFAPRDPETMAETGPQNHPIGEVRFTDGLAFAPRIAEEARAVARPVNPSDDPDTAALAKRIRRKCEIMRLDAPRDSAIRHDLAEIITLAEIIARRAGADDV